jgi:hypothetical protein
VVLYPGTAKMSFNPYGIPCNGPANVPEHHT